jgi:hypothetical protein
MPIAAGVIRDQLIIALHTMQHMTAKHLGSAALYGRHHLQLTQADMACMRAAPRRAVLPKNVCHL